MGTFEEDDDTFEMAFVISLTDGTGREFFINKSSEAVAFDDPGPNDPLILKTTAQVNKHLSNLRKAFPATCSLFVIEQDEFEDRRNRQQGPPGS